MFNVKEEFFLSVFFQIERIARELMSDRKWMFNTLYSVFLPFGANREELYALAQNDTVREIDTYEKYALYRRIGEYLALRGDSVEKPEDVREMIIIKGGALRKVHKIGYDGSMEVTRTEIYKSISDSADKGYIISLIVRGFLQCEGIFVKKNTAGGLSDLHKASKWNSIEASVLLMHYICKDTLDGTDHPFYWDADTRLNTLTKDTIYEEMDYEATCYSSESNKPAFKNMLLQKAFGRGILTPEQYDAQYARILYSRIIDEKGKEYTVFRK